MNENRLTTVEKAHIEKVLKLTKYNKSKAAKELGIVRSTLWKKLREHNIKVPNWWEIL